CHQCELRHTDADALRPRRRVRCEVAARQALVGEERAPLLRLREARLSRSTAGGLRRSRRRTRARAALGARRALLPLLAAHSAFAPVSRTTFAHFATSERTYSAVGASCAAVGSKARASSRWRSCGSWMLFSTASFSFCAMSRGVPAGANTPTQV